MIKICLWTTVWCVAPYILFFGFNRHHQIGSIPILIMALVIMLVVCWYVLFRSGDLPKIER